MSLPIGLIYGLVYLGGEGSTRGKSGVVPNDTNILFAEIYGVGRGMSSGLIGDSVLFKKENIVCILYSDDYPYTVLPVDKIIGEEL